MGIDVFKAGSVDAQMSADEAMEALDEIYARQVQDELDLDNH